MGPARTPPPLCRLYRTGHPLAAQAEAGNVRIFRGRWNGDFLNELCDFPGGKNDDQADAASMAFAKLAKATTGGVWTILFRVYVLRLSRIVSVEKVCFNSLWMRSRYLLVLWAGTTFHSMRMIVLCAFALALVGCESEADKLQRLRTEEALATLNLLRLEQRIASVTDSVRRAHGAVTSIDDSMARHRRIEAALDSVLPAHARGTTIEAVNRVGQVRDSIGAALYPPPSVDPRDEVARATRVYRDSLTDARTDLEFIQRDIRRLLQ